MPTHLLSLCKPPVCIIAIQWNPSITDPFGEQCFGLYTEVAFVERLFFIHTVHLGPGCLAVI